jgi:valyl-tRNA synthetase
MSLPKVYEPNLYEDDIYSLWEKSQAFVPSDEGNAYSIVMPPPNANANLHIGYVLTATLEDIAARYHRLKGESVLLLPGADHAGFETQTVYEKQLAKEGKSRFDFSREELYQQIWDFVAQNRSNFDSQLRKMGVGADWNRFTFTLDEKIVKRAYVTFKKMWDQGLIYRGERLVNFCTFHGTAFADIEVTYTDEASHLWHIRYPLVDGSGEVVVATTRPETLFGDVAVAVNPNDDRYKHFIGKTVKLPLTSRELPIIADEFVDMKFGTGAVKVTPAHDPNDFEIGKRHNLPFVTVISHEGKLIEVPEAYLDLTVEDGRKKTVEDLENQGFMVKTVDHIHSVGHCYKCGTAIQPLLRDQWFIDMQPLAKRAIKALKDNKIKFYPDTKKQQLITYLEGLHNWNISRQLAWGIPIPAFQNVDDKDDWIYDEHVDQAIIEQDGKTYHRDPDTFDTWFSSSSWPYATLGYPDSQDFKQFYPLSLMETGGEILYPWVSRMIMLGLYVTDDIPFKEVYIHGYVMAEDGSKMSKSIGNVVDPIPVIEQFGSDALRLGLVNGRSAAVNRGYDQRKVEDGRNFCNKLWNIARYIETILDDQKSREDIHPMSAADHWILNNLQRFTKKIQSDLDEYKFSEAYESLYHFVWDEFADWYIEASKSNPNKPLLAHVLESVLILAHPFAPFLTETIWQTLAWENDTILATRTFTKSISSDKKQAEAFTEIQAIVSEIRFIVKALQVTDVTLYYKEDKFISENADVIKRLAHIKAATAVKDGSGMNLTSTKHEAWLDIEKIRAIAYVGELEAQKSKHEASFKQLEGRLNNKSYIDNAPKAVVVETEDQLEAVRQQITTIDQEIKRFSN